MQWRIIRRNAISREQKKNKPRTTTVGAISKAQNCKSGDPLTLKIFPNFLNVIFEQCHSAEKCKRGTLWYFLTSIVLQNNKTNEGGPFGAIQKISKKPHSAEKWGLGGILSVFSRFWTCFVLSFRFGRASEVRVF